MAQRSTWNEEEFKSIFEAVESTTSLYLLRSKTEIYCSFEYKEIDAWEKSGSRSTRPARLWRRTGT